jgi:hypothetical protein
VTAPVEHPEWCDRTHGDVPVHGGQVGADLELDGGLSFAVYVSRGRDSYTSVQLLEHTDDETSLVGLSIVEAGILRDLLSEALDLLAREAGR